MPRHQPRHGVMDRRVRLAGTLALRAAPRGGHAQEGRYLTGTIPGLTTAGASVSPAPHAGGPH
jgi:hypothetical protein